MFLVYLLILFVTDLSGTFNFGSSTGDNSDNHAGGGQMFSMFGSGGGCNGNGGNEANQGNASGFSFSFGGNDENAGDSSAGNFNFGCGNNSEIAGSEGFNFGPEGDSSQKSSNASSGFSLF